MARIHVDLELRWGDQDAYGHVNNVAFARFLEEARVRVFFKGNSREETGMQHHFRGDDPAGPKMLVASQRIDYLRVLEYSEKPITIELWIGKLGGSSLELHYEIVENQVLEREAAENQVLENGIVEGRAPKPEVVDGQGTDTQRTVVARAVTTIVIVDGKTLRPMRLSAEGRASVEPWTDEPLRFGRG